MKLSAEARVLCRPNRHDESRALIQRLVFAADCQAF
jgi:hypothetical protein